MKILVLIYGSLEDINIPICVSNLPIYHWVRRTRRTLLFGHDMHDANVFCDTSCDWLIFILANRVVCNNELLLFFDHVLSLHRVGLFVWYQWSECYCNDYHFFVSPNYEPWHGIVELQDCIVNSNVIARIIGCGSSCLPKHYVFVLTNFTSKK